LTPSQARASLTALARLHATFMPAAVAARGEEGGELLAAVTAAVWPSGTYWQPDFQPSRQMTELAGIWRDVHVPSFSAAFADALPGEILDDVATVGERLQEVALALGAEAHPFSADPACIAAESAWASEWKTVIHGDPKAGNIFFREADEAADGWEVGGAVQV
jgi:aminoglycoside phosphotransferase (APT) family kinase protein